MTVMDQAAPSRSLAQRMDALARANVVRSRRAKLKREIRYEIGGRLRAEFILREPPEYAETMKVLDLLLAVPKVGRVKAMTMLNQAHVSPSKTIGGLTTRQRDELVHRLRSRA